MVNDGKLIVVDRQNLELIQQEMRFQLSGEVSDETAQEIGRKLGAQYIISGSMTSLGNMYRMRVQAISVETAQIMGMLNSNVAPDQTLTFLLNAASSVVSAAPSRNAPAVPPASHNSFGKPVKKIPARPGNFEVTQGRQIRAPIDIEKFAEAAKTSITQLKYAIEQEGSGFILFSNSNGRAWWVQIKLCYWDDEYWYEYVDSFNLDANPARNRIHRNYDNWIANLEKQLYTNYYRR
jgi:hypothetical protein